MSYRYRRDYWDPYYDYDRYYGGYDDRYYRSGYYRPGYYTTRDGRWPATSYARHYQLPTKSTTARTGAYDYNRGWYSDTDYYYGRANLRNANVWDIMNHHRDAYRPTPAPATARPSTNSSVYYDYHGRAHRRYDPLPPLYR